MSTVFLPGTMSSMTTGRVTRRWAAWHHPRWFRQTGSIEVVNTDRSPTDEPPTDEPPRFA
jgi:cytochrome b subunit of formate dehydrogenase